MRRVAPLLVATGLVSACADEELTFRAQPATETSSEPEPAPDSDPESEPEPEPEAGPPLSTRDASVSAPAPPDAGKSEPPLSEFDFGEPRPGGGGFRPASYPVPCSKDGGVCPCATNRECPEYFSCDPFAQVCVCDEGLCGACEASYECPPGWSCIDEICFAPCQQGNCPPGWVCQDEVCKSAVITAP